MAEVSAKMVMALRRLTDFRVGECLAIWREHDGDPELVIAWLHSMQKTGLFGIPTESLEQFQRDLIECGITVIKRLGSPPAPDGREHH